MLISTGFAYSTCYLDTIEGPRQIDSTMKKGIIGAAIDTTRYYLSRQEKWRAINMFILLILASLLDVFGLASIVPIVMAASRPGSVLENKYSAAIYHFFDFSSERRFLVFAILVVFAFIVFKNLFTTFINYKQIKFMADIGLKISDSQISKYINLPFWKFQQLGTAQIINDTVGAPGYFMNGMLRQLFNFFSEVIMVVIIVGGILFYQPILFVVLLVVMLPSAALTYRALKNRAQAIGTQLDVLRPKSHSVLTDSLSGFVELKLADKQQLFRQRALGLQRETQDLDAIAFLYSLLPVRVIEMVAILAVVTIFLYSLLFTQTPGNIVAIIGLFAAAAYRLMPSVNRLITALVLMKQNVFSLDVLKSYREYEQPIAEAAQKPITFNNSLAFDHVTFAFPGDTPQPVLKDISFTVRKGEKIGFVGSSGSGKTTLMNVLLRFYQEQQGAVRIDGVALTPEHIAAWHRLIGYVKQDTFLMNGSIKENITLGDQNPDEGRLRSALDQASLTEFVGSLPQGLDTVIGERGSRLSGGQRQRIGIARAMYKQTQILLMDEATSALDNDTEREVNEAISKLAQTDITILIIAHRITTLRDCDRIYELKNGRIVAVHQYDELIQKVI
jgi:ABC-type multidrug transport system fused ATPase/permease subunit